MTWLEYLFTATARHILSPFLSSLPFFSRAIQPQFENPRNGDHRRTTKASRSESIGSLSKTQSLGRVLLRRRPVVAFQVPKAHSGPQPHLNSLRHRRWPKTRSFSGQPGFGNPDVPGPARNLLAGLVLSHPGWNSRVRISWAGRVFKEIE